MANRKNLQINKKRSTHRVTEIKNHGYIKGVTRGAIDPRPGGHERQAIKHYEEVKKKLEKGIKIADWKVELVKKAAAEAKEELNKKNPEVQKKRKEWEKKAWDEAVKTTVKKQMAKDEAEEKARQKKLAEERKKKPTPKKKSPPRRKGVAINRRKARK